MGSLEKRQTSDSNLKLNYQASSPGGDRDVAGHGDRAGESCRLLVSVLHPLPRLPVRQIPSMLFFKDITAPRQRRLARRVTSGKGLKQKSEFFA